ncbi:FAD-dependent oxidoreductase [Candidatus Woesearchaeota archaeon]|nr:FAD-dependent oxidoreductase [Candidatus Woesearchaeota archaeon]
MSTPKDVEAEVRGNKLIAPEVRELQVAAPIEDWQAGQFCTLVFRAGGETHRKPYSIASAPWEKTLTLCVKEVPGGTSSHLKDLEEGSKTRVMGPLGRFTLKQDKDRLLLIGTGTGIAPLRAMIRDLFRKHHTGEGADTEKDVTLLQGATDKDSLLYRDEFRRLAEEAENFKYRTTLSRATEEGSWRGYVHDHLDKAIDDKASTEAYVCGLTDMVEDTTRALFEKGVSQEHIHTERYG